jgi:signal transduction histidine kinase/CheY-like chemotaxis protein/HPt (histidine-containing phosphotransfer) domain-containing protein
VLPRPELLEQDENPLGNFAFMKKLRRKISISPPKIGVLSVRQSRVARASALPPQKGATRANAAPAPEGATQGRARRDTEVGRTVSVSRLDRLTQGRARRNSAVQQSALWGSWVSALRENFQGQSLRRLLLVVLGGCAGLGLHGAWTDHTQGLPSLEFFPSREVGAAATESGFFAHQDARGRIFFGGKNLLVYDGATWRSHALNAGLGLASLAPGTEGRLWGGGLDELGYLTESPTGDFTFTSLLEHLPGEERDLGIIWGCGQSGDRIYFVCASKLLSWDGRRFEITRFATKTRLFPVRLEGELWFTHPETGLYRLTPEGARLEHPASALPPSAAFHLFRQEGELRLISNEGIFTAGRPDTPLCSPEFSQFGIKNRISAVVAAADATYYIATAYGGIAVVSPKGELLRVLDTRDGLPSNTVPALLVDRDGCLWGVTDSGPFRIEAPGKISVFNEQNGLGKGAVKNLRLANGSLMGLTDSGVFRLAVSEPRSLARFVPIPTLTQSYQSLAPVADGLLVGGFATIEYHDGTTSRIVHAQATKSFWGLSPLPGEPPRATFVSDKTLSLLTRLPSGEWRAEALTVLPDISNAAWPDAHGDLWLNTLKSGILHYEPATRRLTRLPDGEPTEQAADYHAFAGQGDRLYFARNNRCYQLDPATRQPTALGEVPHTSAIRDLQPSADGRRLYACFERPRPSGSSVGGLGYFDLTTGRSPAPWHELQIAGLNHIGITNTLLVFAEEGADTVWLGGSEGLLRLRPDELPMLQPPAHPRLTLLSAGSAPQPGSLPAAFPFFGHKVSLRVDPPEVLTRRTLLFQTRLAGDESAPWSAPTERDSFEFTNLSDGPYTFAVRSVNPAGQMSEPAVFSFRILPPWYRTGWAYGGYIGALAAGVLAFVRIRERRMLERNRHLEQIVAERTAELVRANAAKDEFLAGVSHEIRNPMNGVVGLASTIDLTSLDPASRQRFAYLRHCATHLASLLDDILDFSKLQAGAVSLDPQPFNLRELVESIAAITVVESRQAGIPVETAVSPAVPALLVGDAARIRQILLNYVINALKYAGSGTVCLTVWVGRVTPESCEVTFAVSDDGPGISPEEQKKIFARFERGQAAKQNRVSGAGLGLALCKTLAEKMGGRLWLESEGGHGSTFFFAVPLPVAARATLTLRPAPPTQPPPVFRALVVDDEEYNRLALAGMLAELGFESDSAAEGEEALAAARDRKYDAIFLDFELPGMSGLDIARGLRALPGLPADLPIVATTAYGTPEKRAQCFAAGMNAFLSKPVSPEKIRSALDAVHVLSRPAAPWQAPAGEGDPLAALRLIASRKGVPFADELALFRREFDEENAALEDALRQRDAAPAARAAHRLSGRLGFVQAFAADDCVREIEAAATNEIWERADAAWARYQEALPPLRQRLNGDGP